MNIRNFPQLPISVLLPQITASLDTQPNLVIIAPPGAGKTTLLPLALLDADWRSERKILILEPRRLAARAAANRMAALLGEKTGEAIGYRVRFDTKISARTIIEVVTEGVFTRMLASDPGLEDVAAVLFDEYHERSLDSDLALALCLDLQAGLREDLRLVAMSATLDGSAVSKLIKAPVLESEGRQHPVEITYRPRPPRERIEIAMADSVLSELRSQATGDILAFLPGRGEIERVAADLGDRVPQNIHVHKLYGAISTREQEAAIAPTAPGSRKVVLASAIAETSLTIEGVTTVIDSGLARQAVFEPATGLARLETVRASRATVTQRAGRAGRLGPGKAVRLWHEGQTASLPAASPPEILNADLAPLLLDLADWGVSEPTSLAWLDPPPKPALAEARALLQDLGALNTNGTLTAHGRQMRTVPLPPRLAHMVVCAARTGRKNAKQAALLALLLQERGAGGMSVDLGERLRSCQRSKSPRERKLGATARRIAETASGAGAVSDTGGDELLSDGVLLAFAFPDRVAKYSGQPEAGILRYKLANGRAVQIAASDALSSEKWLVVADLTGRAAGARIGAAAAITKQDVLEHLADRVSEHRQASFDERSGRFTATQVARLGALDIAKPQTIEPDTNDIRQAVLDTVERKGLGCLPWSQNERAFLDRLRLLHQHDNTAWPDMSEARLSKSLEEWLSPFLPGVASLADFSGGRLKDGLALLAGYPDERAMERLLPKHFTTPSGDRVPINYEGEVPTVSARPQQLFGLKDHPAVFEGRLPLAVELLSPAGRPMQITRDLPGFWTGSWTDLRADLRGRYPKHPWPEDPANATPTSRAKPRK